MTPAIAARVRALRRAREWSAEQLAQAMRAAGIRWDRATQTNLELGRRRSITVDEWLALAKVLDVAALDLLCPIDGPRFKTTPTSPAMGADAARAWLIGTGAATTTTGGVARVVVGGSKVVETQADRDLAARVAALEQRLAAEAAEDQEDDA